ncbi:hypothetical protein GH714_010960 [Hevea brasiliensis]|uniref:FF domain-containing protein n=1 Tax=Hevea brasiliensis TaxID=3981 RepID=A0A6A6NGG7_HEVBR|nr:hypothetical protein GH714_010960 [Hevea brasiliensis]
MPEELKLALEQAQQTVSQGTQSEADAASHALTAVAVTLSETSATAISVSSSSSALFGVASSRIPITPVAAVSNPAVVVSGSSALPVAQSNIANAAAVQPPVVTLTPLPTAVSGSASVTTALVNSKTPEVKKGMAVAGKSDANPLEEKTLDDEPLVFSNKLEAKNAFKALLKAANVQSDWTWKQVNSPWRKVQGCLEDDERCLRLGKLDHLLTFQEQLRRAERKNRDAFCKLLEDHVADGSYSENSLVKYLPQYHAVATNTSGSTPRDLFEGVAEELEKQITMSSTWTFEDFKAAISDDVSSPPISDINLKITAYSSWDDCKQLFEESREYRSIGVESFSRGLRNILLTCRERLKRRNASARRKSCQKRREREEKEKRNERERKREGEGEGTEREKGKERTKKDKTDGENVDPTENYSHKEGKKMGKDKDRKHRRQHQSGTDYHSYLPELDNERRHKRHKIDHRDGS